MPTDIPSDTTIAKRRRGRPKGSRNRPKPAEATPAIKPAAMRIDTAARYLDVSVSTVRRLIRDRRVEAVSLGTAKLVLTRSLDALLERDS